MLPPESISLRAFLVPFVLGQERVFVPTRLDLIARFYFHLCIFRPMIQRALQSLMPSFNFVGLLSQFR